MFKFNTTVKDKNTGEVFRVVAPIVGEEWRTAVWADVDCREIRIFPTDTLEGTDEHVIDGVYGRIVYDIKAIDEDKLEVNREVTATGLDAILATYADFRGFVSERSPMSMLELDSLIDNRE